MKHGVQLHFNLLVICHLLLPLCKNNLLREKEALIITIVSLKCFLSVLFQNLRQRMFAVTLSSKFHHTSYS